MLWCGGAGTAGTAGAAGARGGDARPARVRSRLDGSSLMRSDICLLNGELEEDIAILLIDSFKIMYGKHCTLHTAR